MIDFRECSHELDLELTEHKFIPKIRMKQYDSQSRYIKVKLYNKGYEFDITDNALSFRVVFRKPDGKVVFNTCTVVNGAEKYLILPVTANTLSTVGLIATELVIMQGTSIFSSLFFYINCLPSLHADKGAIESNDDYSGLLESIIKVEELMKDFENLNSIITMHYVIDVVGDTKTVSFLNWADWTTTSGVEVFLSGVKQIEGIDYNIDPLNRTITMIGNKTFKNGDQVLLCSLRRVNHAGYTDPDISANKVILNPAIENANNVQTALTNIHLKFGDYLPTDRYEAEVGDVNALKTNDKTVVGAINELKDLLDKLEADLGNKPNGYTKLVGTVNLVAPAKAINIPIVDYDPNTDELNVYIAGAKMVEGVAYQIDKNLKAVTCLNGEWDANVQIYFEAIKFN